MPHGSLFEVNAVFLTRCAIELRRMLLLVVIGNNKIFY